MKIKLSKKSEPKGPNDALKYADLGWRMLSMVGVSVAAGYFLNKKFPETEPLFLVSLPLIGLAASMYVLIKAGSVQNKNKKDESNHTKS